jgi:Zn-finger domain-containing protein
MIFFKDQGREKISTTAIQLVFRGLKFDSDTDIDGKVSFRLDTLCENELEACRNHRIETEKVSPDYKFWG